MTGRLRWLAPGWAAMALVLVLAALPAAAVEAVRWPLLLVGFLVAGMPHGALDHLVPGWARGAADARGRVAAFCALYVLVVVAVVALWLVDPVAGLGLLLASAAVHWGLGEAWPLRTLVGRRGPVAASAAARGLLMVAVPGLVRPEAFARACTDALAALPGAPRVAPLGSAAQAAGLAVVAAIVLLAVGAALRDARRGDPGAPLDVAELVLLAAALSLGDPALAVGAAFVAWHAPRQLARLAALAPEPGLPVVARAAVAPTLVALAGCAALAVATGAGAVGAAAAAGVALAVVGGLTVPHALVAGWLDLRCELPAGRVAASHEPV